MFAYPLYDAIWFIALLLPWFLPLRRGWLLILSAALLTYALVLLAVWLYDQHLHAQWSELSGGKEFFTPQTPQAQEQADALLNKMTKDSARRLAPYTLPVPCLLYVLLIAAVKNAFQKFKQQRADPH